MELSLIGNLAFVATGLCMARVFVVTLGRQAEESRRRHCLVLLAAMMTIGAGWIVAYSMNNYMLGQDEIPGDASFFLDAAGAIADGYDVDVAHRIYPAWLAVLLGFGDAGIWLDRVLQLVALASAICAGVYVLFELRAPVAGIRFFIVACALNAGLYSLAFVLVRDGLMLATLLWALFFAVRVARPEPLQPVGRHLDGLCLASAVLLLYMLQPLVFALVVLAVCLAAIVRMFAARATGIGDVAVAAAVLLVAGLCLYYLESEFELSRLVEVNFFERQRLVGDRDFVAITALEAEDVPFYEAFGRFVFGPGVVRPLFPEEYFPISYPFVYNLAYFLAVLGWYVTIVKVIPKAFEALRRAAADPVLSTVAIFVVLFISSYALADAGQGGLRKRAMMYVGTWLVLAASAFAEPAPDARVVKVTDTSIGRLAMRTVAVAGLVLITLRSIQA